MSISKINSAIHILKQECAGHTDCDECPLAVKEYKPTGVEFSCRLSNEIPFNWPEVDDE